MPKQSTISRRGLLAAAIAAPAGYAIAADGPWQSQISTAQNLDGPFRLLSPPVLTNPTDTGVTVLWATNASASGVVEYGESQDLGQVAHGGEQGLTAFADRHLKVRLEGLKPGTKYFYRVRSHYIYFNWKEGGVVASPEPPAVSEIYSFTTPTADAGEVHFTVWNDTHENVETLTRLHAAHQQSPGDFLLYNGDVTNDFYSYQKMADQMLAPAGLPFAASTPYYFVRGNHDARGHFARQLGEVTDVPEGKFYYWFRRGPLAAIVLDTGEDKPDDHPAYRGLANFAAFRSHQAEWLGKTLAEPAVRSAPIKVLFCHIPLWWRVAEHTGTYCLDGQKKWHELLADGGIQLVMSGHTHEPHYMPPDRNRPYGQLIGGGPQPRHATYMQGHADGERLVVRQFRLNGEELHEVKVGG